jgi:hypothetical protein
MLTTLYSCLSLTVESFVAIVTDCVSLGRIRAGEEVYKILSVGFYSLSSAKYDNVNIVNGGYDSEDWLGSDQQSALVTTTLAAGATTAGASTMGNNANGDNGILQHPCAQLQKLLSIGSFYFTPDFDLTKTVQSR